MTKLYGIYVGTPKQASPFQPVDDAYERTYDELLVRDTVIVNTAASGTIIQVARDIGWDTILSPTGGRVFWGALGAGVTLSLGVAGFATSLDNAIDVHAAGNATLLSAIGIASYYQPLWQLVGYATLAAALAVSPQAELIFTTGGATSAASNISLTWQMYGARRK